MGDEQIGKVPPHNNEAELATLGAILLNPRDIVMDDVFAKLRIEDFYRLAHQKIYSSIRNLVAKGESVDIITLAEELRSQHILDEVGGPAYIATITSMVPTSSNILYYTNIVRENSMRRTLLHITGDMSDDAFDKGLDITHIIDNAERRIFNITNNQYSEGFKHSKASIANVVDNIEHHYRNPGLHNGIPSGFPKLDNMIDGFQKSEFIVIGARPSVGKTALALTMTRNICLKKNIPTGFFSLEMSDVQLMQRLLSMETHINSSYLRKGKIKAADFHAINNAAAVIYEAPLYFCDTPNMRLLDLKTQSRRMKSLHKVEIIFIDYLSIITPENDTKDRHVQVAEVSRSLKALARELNTPIVALSQLSRDSEGKEPHLASIRESGAIEQDADVVLFIHRDKSKDSEFPETEANIIVAKNRNGPVGKVRVHFLPPYAEFRPTEHYN